MKKPNYLSRKEAADYLNIKSQTLAVWASVGRYKLPFIKIGRKVYYLEEHLDEFLRSRTYTATLRHGMGNRK